MVFAWLGPITKVESDGLNRYVWGKVTDGSIDSDEQIVDPTWAKRAMAEWYDTGANVRQQHSTQLAPAGKGILLEHKESDGEYVKTKVVDANAIRLVDEGVYTGYSVGISRPRIERDNKARGGRIVGGKICEISLVDRPALPTAKFAICKRASNGSMEFVGKVVILDGEPDDIVATSAGLLPTPSRALKRIRQGAHVTVHVRNDGVLEAIEGRVLNKSKSGISLDLSGYGSDGTVLLADEDIEGVYKGRVPLEVITKHVGIPDEAEFLSSIQNDSSREITSALRRLSQWAGSGEYPVGLDRADVEKMYRSYTSEMRTRNSGFDPGPLGSPLGLGRIGKCASLTTTLDAVTKSADADLTKAGGYTHTHTHTGPDGVTHKHSHSHAAGTPDHSELHEGGAHAHGHPETTDIPTEDDDSVTAEDQIAQPEDVKADACAQCKGTGLFEGVKCNKCGGKVVKQAAEAHAAAADAHAAAADAADDPDEAAEHADAADDQADAADDAASDEADAADEEPEKAKKAAKKTFAPAAADAAPTDTDAADAAPAKPTFPFKKAKKCKVSEVDGKFVVTSKGETLGTHNTLEAAEAQKAAVTAERKAAKTSEDEIPWLVRRAHDYTCSAYKAEDVAETYPSIEKNGVEAALSPATGTTLMSLLKQEMSQGNAHAIASLGKAIGSLGEFLDAETASGPEFTDTVLSARADLVTAFKAANPDVGSLPKPSETITPGQFKRPYISAGNQSESGSAKAPRIPTTTHPIRATDFTRGPLTAEHQRYLATKMAEFHDALSSWKPELCRMDAGGYAPDRLPAEFAFRGLQVPNQESASPTPVASTTLNAASKSLVIPETELVAKSYTEAELQAALGAALQPYISKVSHLESQYNELAASPDPARSANRGVTGMGTTKISMAVTKKAQRQVARKDKRANKIAYYRLLSDSSDPEMRIHAQRRLADLGEDA